MKRLYRSARIWWAFLCVVLLGGCDAGLYVVDCPSWAKPVTLVRTRTGFWTLIGTRVWTSDTQCSFGQIIEGGTP